MDPIAEAVVAVAAAVAHIAVLAVAPVVHRIMRHTKRKTELLTFKHVCANAQVSLFFLLHHILSVVVIVYYLFSNYYV